MTQTAVDRSTSAVHTGSGASAGWLFGSVLCRIVVPLWVLAGASFKLYERNPANLPSVIRDISRSVGMENLDLLLRALIGAEFFAVAVMLLMPRLARAMAIFMLSCFCVILIGEMIKGATSCGCFGSLPVKPWQMLVVDGTLLGLVLMFRPRSAHMASPASFGHIAVMSAVFAAVSMGVAFAVPQPAAIEQQVAINPSDASADNQQADYQQADNQQPTQTADPTTPTQQDADPNNDTATSNEPPAVTQQQVAVPQPVVPSSANLPPTVNPSPRPLPASWYTQKMNEWIGKPWRELELFQMMPTWPREMDSGPRYIVFYSRTCDHCRHMLDFELVDPLDGLVTLVEIPASRTVMTDPSGWPMPMTVELVLGAELLQLPLGPNWIITPPLVIKVMDGKVVCAIEAGNYKSCLGL